MAYDDDDYYPADDDFDVERYEGPDDDGDWDNYDWPDDWDDLAADYGWEVWDIDVDVDYGPE